MLQTEVPGLRLCPMTSGDAGELFALTAANRAHLRRWLPWVDEMRSAADTAAYVRNALEMQRLELRIDYTLRFNDRMIGTIAYHSVQRSHRCGILGYWLEFASTGRGYMTAAVRRMVEHGFSDLKLNRIEVRVAIGNDASQKVCDRLSFKAEGVLRE